ncbi:hypothetical protein Lupro_12790 [Lutibacter profundi]|uniref:Metal-dependent hydrolase n=1 Tax=Lutibacter profundi TaxID=1622118 RepID=A0A109RPB5_9FLAO|nr:DUF6122 family protein [Lutibacter profundi]AMC12277.1 hypothetical protein Lupro_12790 [Lutibacter profundi]
MLRFLTHYGMHFLVPGVIAYLFFKNNWKKVWLLFILTMLVDLDHLIATPLFDATRCSINFHPLHSYYAIGLYLLLLFVPKLRILAIGLLFHMFTDFIDCFWI